MKINLRFAPFDHDFNILHKVESLISPAPCHTTHLCSSITRSSVWPKIQENKLIYTSPDNKINLLRQSWGGLEQEHLEYI